jgi:hypothetical protein
MKVRFLSVADRELADAFEWHEHTQLGLGYSLINEIDRTIHRVTQYPESCPDSGDGLRRALVNRFPYGIWYAIDRDELVVYAVAHLHRRPRYGVGE